MSKHHASNHATSTTPSPESDSVKVRTMPLEKAERAASSIPTSTGVRIGGKGEAPMRMRVGRRIRFVRAPWLRGTVREFLSSDRVHISLEEGQWAISGNNGESVAFRDVIVPRRFLDFEE